MGGFLFILIWGVVFIAQILESKKRQERKRQTRTGQAPRPQQTVHRSRTHPQHRHPLPPAPQSAGGAWEAPPESVKDFFEKIAAEADLFRTSNAPIPRRKKQRPPKPVVRPAAPLAPPPAGEDAVQVETRRSAKETHLHLPRIEALAVHLEKLPQIPMPQLEKRLVDHPPHITLSDRFQLRQAMRLHILLSPPKSIPLDMPPRP